MWKTLVLALVLAAALRASALTLTGAPAQATTLPGDFNGDCVVNALDLSMIASRFLAARGSLLYEPRFDLNNDGVINILDIQVVAAEFGTHC